MLPYIEVIDEVLILTQSHQSEQKRVNFVNQVLKLVIESGGWGGCAPMYYARVNFCNVLRQVAAWAA